ncbi:MAG: hypothetical protein ACK5NK_11145 [Niabella sp.]
MKESHLFIFIIFIGLLFLFACHFKTKGEKEPDTDSLAPENPNISYIISDDMSRLNSLLDLEQFKPDSVAYLLQMPQSSQYKKIHADSSKFVLEAVLFFNEAVYGKILEKYMDEDFPKGNYKKNDFEFSWLPDILKNELNLSKPEYPGNPDIFMGTNGKAKLWFLDKKILVSYEN